MDQLIFKFPFSKTYYKQEFFVSGNNFNAQGNVRVKVTRSGQQGELFKIQMTDTMGNTGATQTHASSFIGQTNDYNPDYELNFSLLKILFCITF